MNLTAHTDGASKGNPGHAAIGFTIEKDGIVLEEFFEYIGKATNNVAEYKALIAVLKRLKSLGATHVKIATDSELAARQINGIYKVKNPGLKPLFAEVMRLSVDFEFFGVIHVPREQNSTADGLANLAINNHLKSIKK